MPPITFGLTLPTSFPPRLLFAIARLAEAVGFDRLWFPDHLLNTTHDQPAVDVWTVMAAVAVKTRRITLGTAVSDAHREHPAVLAQRLATLDQLSRGRVILGIGSGEAMNLDPFGIPWNKPLSRMKETVHVVRSLLDSPEPVSFEGKFYRLRNARVTVRPYRERRIPIYVAALGPRTLKYTGEVADGWLPVTIPSSHYGAYLAPILEAAAAAGRDPGSIDRVAMLPMALSEDRGRVGRAVRRYALSLVWPEVVEHLGMGHRLPEGLRSADYRTMNPCDPESLQRFRENQEKVPEDLLMEFVTFGTLWDIEKRVSEFVREGATHLDIINATPDPLTSTVALAARLLPRFTGRRPTLAARLLDLLLPQVARTGVLKALTRRLPAARRLEED